MKEEICAKITDAVLDLLAEQEKEYGCSAQHGSQDVVNLILFKDGRLNIVPTTPLRHKEFNFGEEEINFGEIDKALKERSDSFREKFRTIFRPTAMRILPK